jgi:hypothetical protein
MFFPSSVAEAEPVEKPQHFAETETTIFVAAPASGILIFIKRCKKNFQFS